MHYANTNKNAVCYVSLRLAGPIILLTKLFRDQRCDFKTIFAQKLFAKKWRFSQITAIFC
jgi:hypothetical protein